MDACGLIADSYRFAGRRVQTIDADAIALQTMRGIKIQAIVGDMDISTPTALQGVGYLRTDELQAVSVITQMEELTR